MFLALKRCLFNSLYIYRWIYESNLCLRVRLNQFEFLFNAKHLRILTHYRQVTELIVWNHQQSVSASTVSIHLSPIYRRTAKHEKVYFTLNQVIFFKFSSFLSMVFTKISCLLFLWQYLSRTFLNFIFDQEQMKGIDCYFELLSHYSFERIG